MSVKRWKAGDTVPALTLETIHATTVDIPGESLTHLQFRRFAGCPVCNLHLRSFVRRRSEIEAAGIHEVIFFHSTAGQLREHADDLPLAVVADPGKRFYAMFGAEAGRRALSNPRAWGGILAAVAVSLVDVLRGRKPVPPIDPEGGRWGLPADLLIDRDGTIVAVKYGEHADDQWSVDEVIQIASGRHSARPAVLNDK
ncbi:MAG TPA: peroxiredoxin-like family protein [Candidatus Limnocylindrales bacterium]